MKIDTYELPVKPMEGFEAPSVTALHAQRDGTLLCGLAFANPCLWRVKGDASGITAQSMNVEKDLGAGLLGVTGGLRAQISGDTAFATIHEGFAPGFVQKLSGGGLRGRKGEELMKALEEQSGGMGVSVRHSIVQITEGEIRVRRFREPGVVLDAAHIGDFLFGLVGSSFWREPYLNTEKREVLRKDLEGNVSIHRDNVGNFWFEGAQGRLLRMRLTDIKAKPTPLKLPDYKAGHRFENSTASLVDEWLYGVSGEGRKLFRVRVNPISNEDEFQMVAEFPVRVTGLVFVGERPAFDMADFEEAPDPTAETATAPKAKGGRLVVAVEHPEGVELLAGEAKASDDPEVMNPPPKLASLGRVPGVKSLASLTWDGKHLWGGEGRLGGGDTSGRKPRVFRIEL